MVKTYREEREVLEKGDLKCMYLYYWYGVYGLSGKLSSKLGVNKVCL